jgi:hypothetical protein
MNGYSKEKINRICVGIILIGALPLMSYSFLFYVRNYLFIWGPDEEFYKKVYQE